MGIKGLLPLLADVATTINVFEDLRGKCVGVDAFVWLHVLAITFLEEVLEKRYDRLAVAFVRRGRRFLAAGVDVVYVFDGKPVPAKNETAVARNKLRAAAQTAAQGHLPGTDEHTKALAAAVSITPDMIAAVLSALRTDGQRYMVAPYEADPRSAASPRQAADHRLRAVGGQRYDRTGGAACAAQVQASRRYGGTV